MKHKISHQAGFHLLPVLVFILFTVVIVAVGMRVAKKQNIGPIQTNSGGKFDASDPFVQQYGNNCEEKPGIEFTNSPIATDQVGYIEPMGKMLDGHVTPTDHVYIAPLNPDAADNSYNVVMPADGRIVDISAMPAQYIGDRQDVKTAAADHRIVVSFNCRYYSIFIHVHKLSAKVAAQVGTLAPNTNKQVIISLKAGEPIGQIGGNPVDWTMVDVNTKLTGFVSPKLYEREPWKIHAIDPFSVYKGTLQAQMKAKSLRSTEPVGGKIDLDRPKTLQGNWFKVGSNGYAGSNPERYWDGHLSVVPNHIDPNSVTVSIGNWEGKARQFTVKGSANPAQVTKANSPVKYELLAPSYITKDGAAWIGRTYEDGLRLSQQAQVMGTIMFEVQDGEKIRVEKFPGKTAAQVTTFTVNAETYTR